MQISIITVFPELYQHFLQTSLIKRAVDQNRISIDFVKLSTLCDPKKRIDEPTCGPGAGMIIKPELIELAIQKCQAAHGNGFVIFFSPQGKRLNQKVFQTLAQRLCTNTNEQTKTSETPSYKHSSHLILVCSRYEGIDARVEEYYADLVVSIGDYVLMGGDLPAQVFLEGLLRLVPGIVGSSESVIHESFSGPFLDHPEYGQPLEWNGLQVPAIVSSGNHAAIAAWRKEEACKKTLLNRFDWFNSAHPSKEDITLAQKHIPPHYVALMHCQVKLKGGLVGTTSITSIDLHDTARSCATYGVKNFFMVSPLQDQQAIMATFLDFWRSDEGKEYNQSRYNAVSRVKTTASLDEVIATIVAQEGKEPIIIATSAKSHAHQQFIDFTDQGTVWKHNRPVLFLFGTGQGLADEVVEKSTYLLPPVRGMTNFNHLSVRSAIAIILDRWLGLHS